MPCALTKGRVLDCKDQLGGLKYIYLGVFSDLESATVVEDVDGQISDLGTLSVYKYVLPANTANAVETITASPENGTLFFSQALTMALNKLTAEDRNEIKLIASNRIFAVAEDFNGNQLLYGYQNGLDANGGTVETGTAKGDRSGYTLTFLGEEPSASNHLSAAIEDMPTITIVSS